MNWLRTQECIGCEESGHRSNWLSVASALVCREHEVWLEEMLFTSQAYWRFRNAELAWQEHCATLISGGMCDDAQRRAMTGAQAAVGDKLRQLFQMLRDQKPDLVANRRAEEEAQKKARKEH